MSAPPVARITALGGGTGLASLLRGLKRAPVHLTAIVTVADDGGSSGRLRRELGVLPPGDIRNCLVALADDESLMGRLFQHRFADGDLSGHPFGNLFLAALAEVTGNFDLAIQECSRVLKIRGSVLPSTLRHVHLWAERENGERVRGETNIAAGVGPCRRVWLDPPPEAHGPALDAIAQADLVVLGPGSLFTSVLPHLAVPEIAAALARSRAPRATWSAASNPSVSPGWVITLHTYARVLEAAPGSVDVAVLHDGPVAPDAVAAYAAQGQHLVTLDRGRVAALGVRAVTADLAQAGSAVRHDPDALASVLLRLAMEAVGRPDAALATQGGS
ncbi:MAG TPA: gluconeogenesis factor YvcK family protein [Miltoncostaeaceae bacterium]|nr:gluconeogenesis factor YvcK family protein [Miltoncostaeaceae bacterium]